MLGCFASCSVLCSVVCSCVCVWSRRVSSSSWPSLLGDPDGHDVFVWRPRVCGLSAAAPVCGVGWGTCIAAFPPDCPVAFLPCEAQMSPCESSSFRRLFWCCMNLFQTIGCETVELGMLSFHTAKYGRGQMGSLFLPVGVICFQNILVGGAHDS